MEPQISSYPFSTFSPTDTPLAVPYFSCPCLRLRYLSILYPTTLNQQGNKALISWVEPITKPLPWSYVLSKAILVDFHHDGIKGNMKRVVMHTRVSLNSYNVNALVNYKVMTIIKWKTLMGWYAPVLAFAWEGVSLLAASWRLTPKAPSSAPLA
jgi:hypothetical protein